MAKQLLEWSGCDPRESLVIWRAVDQGEHQAPSNLRFIFGQMHHQLCCPTKDRLAWRPLVKPVPKEGIPVESLSHPASPARLTGGGPAAIQARLAMWRVQTDSSSQPGLRYIVPTLTQAAVVSHASLRLHPLPAFSKEIVKFSTGTLAVSAFISTRARSSFSPG